MYFAYYIYSNVVYYIKLNGNETISDALNKMVNNDNINVKDSIIKEAIDYWYEHNIKNTQYEKYLEDTVFCNDRTIDDIGGWSETGTLGALKFNAYNGKYYLKCPNKRDAFTVSDGNKGNSALTYPVGLINGAESLLSGNNTFGNIGSHYWTISPRFMAYWGLVLKYVGDKGENYYGNVYYKAAMRPSISLKPGIKFVAGGDGTASNPYEVDMSASVN